MKTKTVHSAFARVWLEIDVARIRANYRRIARAVAPCTVIAVLKANAYGLGVQPLATALAEEGAGRFAVAGLNEALALQSTGVPVQILGCCLPEEIGPAIEAGVVLPIADETGAQAISTEAVRQGRVAKCQILVDTGMGRLGLAAGPDPAGQIRRLAALPGIEMEGLYSHFPVAYRAGGAYTEAQIATFLELLTALETAGMRFAWRHMANSDAVNNFPQTYRPPFNAVRTGINLHGSFDTEGQRALALQPVLTLKSRLVCVRRMAAGRAIGYGCTYTCPRAMTVGVVAAGYADGLPLALSNRGSILLRGVPCPVLGRVSMDYTTIDLSQAPEAVAGDEVICLGGAGPTAVTVEDWAQLKGTHSYDIICSFGSRVERCYVTSGAET